MNKAMTLVAALLAAVMLAACGAPAEEAGSAAEPAQTGESSSAPAEESISEPEPEPDPYAELLQPVYGLFEANDIEGVIELVQTQPYLDMWGSLEGPQDSYYFGEMDAEGQRQGKGLAIYKAPSTLDHRGFYYFGNWEGGLREGKAQWVGAFFNDWMQVGQEVLEWHHGEYTFANDLPQGAFTYSARSALFNWDEEAYSTFDATYTGNCVDGLYDGMCEFSAQRDSEADLTYMFEGRFVMGQLMPYDDPPVYDTPSYNMDDEPQERVIVGRLTNTELPWNGFIGDTESMTEEQLEQRPLYTIPGFEYLRP